MLSYWVWMYHASGLRTWKNFLWVRLHYVVTIIFLGLHTHRFLFRIFYLRYAFFGHLTTRGLAIHVVWFGISLFVRLVMDTVIYTFIFIFVFRFWAIYYTLMVVFLGYENFWYTLLLGMAYLPVWLLITSIYTLLHNTETIRSHLSYCFTFFHMDVFCSVSSGSLRNLHPYIESCGWTHQLCTCLHSCCYLICTCSQEYLPCSNF